MSSPVRLNHMSHTNQNEMGKGTQPPNIKHPKPNDWSKLPHTVAIPLTLNHRVVFKPIKPQLFFITRRAPDRIKTRFLLEKGHWISFPRPTPNQFRVYLDPGKVLSLWKSLKIDDFLKFFSLNLSLYSMHVCQSSHHNSGRWRVMTHLKLMTHSDCRFTSFS